MTEPASLAFPHGRATTLRVPAARVRPATDRPANPDGAFVLYWVTAARRVRWNFALQAAAGLARDLHKPLVVIELLHLAARHDSDRLHAFAIEGMRDNARNLRERGIAYRPCIEKERGAGWRLLEDLAPRAVAVFADDPPPHACRWEGAERLGKLPAPVLRIDGWGLWPLHATDRAFPTACSFRRHLQKHLPPYLEDFPDPNLPPRMPKAPADSAAQRAARPEPHEEALLRGPAETFRDLPIDHQVAPVETTRGGEEAARDHLGEFLVEGLERYESERNHPDADAASRLSPWLRFGHISPHEIFFAVTAREGWSPSALGVRATGSKTGWWGLSPSAEAFLDEVITWREVSANGAAHMEDYDRFGALPEWALETLREHESDPRPYLYNMRRDLETARTHDDLWNAAQSELRRDGRVHNYLRMLWGKKILQWSPTPRDALDAMLHLNDRWALDGRDPNSVSGVFWVLGRYDRAWGPERPVFGKVRYMTSESTRRKLRLAEYVRRYSPAG